MRRFLSKALNEKQLIEIIYISDKQTITQRTIQISEINQHTIRAYCFLRKQSRLFKINNILSVLPKKQKEPFIS
jgi:predicted DNA-binding transcriptional regulator YafY